MGEPEMFLLLPFAPAAILLSSPEPLHFGFLEVHRRSQPVQPGAGVRWLWERFFFMLRLGHSSDERLLVWCLHPNAEEPHDWMPLDCIIQIRSLDKHGDHCLAIDRRPSDTSQLTQLTLRAWSPEVRDAWMSAIRSARTG